MADSIALILTRLDTTCFGLDSLVGHSLAGRSVLAHTVARVARVKSLSKIILVHGVYSQNNIILMRSIPMIPSNQRKYLRECLRGDLAAFK